MRKMSRLMIALVLLGGCVGQAVDETNPDGTSLDGIDVGEAIVDPLDTDVSDVVYTVEDGPEPDDLVLPEESILAEETIARVDVGDSFVQWVAPEGVEDETLIIIGGRGDALPLIDMDTAETLGAVELFIALAPETMDVPERLLERATDLELEMLRDPVAINALRTRVAIELDSMRVLVADEIARAEAQPRLLSHTCSVSQIATARSVYGIGYTSSATCGEQRGFETRTRNYYYCNGGDCEYGLGKIDGGSCPLNNPCDHARGRLTSRTMRSNTSGNPNFQTGGYRIRSFAYNCHGTGANGGALTMRVRHGSGWDLNLQVQSGYYRGAYWNGSDHLPARARAISRVSNGQIHTDIGTGGSGWAATQYNIGYNTANNDRGIFCADVQRSLDVTAGNPQNCHSGHIGWCLSSCGGCFN